MNTKTTLLKRPTPKSTALSHLLLMLTTETSHTIRLSALTRPLTEKQSALLTKSIWLRASVLPRSDWTIKSEISRICLTLNSTLKLIFGRPDGMSLRLERASLKARTYVLPERLSSGALRVTLPRSKELTCSLLPRLSEKAISMLYARLKTLMIFL